MLYKLFRYLEEVFRYELGHPDMIYVIRISHEDIQMLQKPFGYEILKIERDICIWNKTSRYHLDLSGWMKNRSDITHKNIWTHPDTIQGIWISLTNITGHIRILIKASRYYSRIPFLTSRCETKHLDILRTIRIWIRAIRMSLTETYKPSGYAHRPSECDSRKLKNPFGYEGTHPDVYKLIT